MVALNQNLDEKSRYVKSIDLLPNQRYGGLNHGAITHSRRRSSWT